MSVKRVRYVSLLDHEINMMVGDDMIEYPSSSHEPIRLKVRQQKYAEDEHGVPTVMHQYVHDDKIVPSPVVGTLYVVPKSVAEAYNQVRKDFVFPGTNPKKDNCIIENGKIVCVRRFRFPDRVIFARKVGGNWGEPV